MTRAVLRAISPEWTAEEVAAIVAAIAELTRPVAVAPPANDTLHEWVHAARIVARRSPVQRGPWRLSGRIGRRTAP